MENTTEGALTMCVPWRRASLLTGLIALLLWTQSSLPTAASATLVADTDRIDSPANGATVSGVVEIRGRATGPDISQFSFYRILLGEGRDPSAMRPLGPPYDTPVEGGVLATWDTDRFPAGAYTLMLRVYDRADQFTTASVLVTVADKPTPTPMRPTGPVVFATPVEVAPDAPAPAAFPASGPPGAGDGTIPLEIPTLIALPTFAPITSIPGLSGPGAPLNPIPIDPGAPPPVRLDTPAQTDPAQLPFSPAPVYITPITFNP